MLCGMEMEKKRIQKLCVAVYAPGSYAIASNLVFSW